MFHLSSETARQPGRRCSGEREDWADDLWKPEQTRGMFRDALLRVIFSDYLKPNSYFYI